MTISLLRPIPATPTGPAMRTARRSLPILAMAAGVVFAVAAYREWRREASRPLPGAQLSFLPALQDLGVTAPGESRKVVFTVKNLDDARPARLLGAEEHCDRLGCIFWKGAPTTIRPGEERTFEVEWKGIRPGRLVQSFPVYTDCPGQMEVRLSIAGEVTPPRVMAAATPR